MTAQEMWDRSGFQGNYQAWAFGGAPDKLAGQIGTARGEDSDLFIACPL